MPHPSVVRPVSLLSAAILAITACSDETRPLPTLSVSAVAASDAQSTIAGAALPLPLRVLVKEDGVPKAGVSVSWSAAAGAVTPASSASDANGIAAAQWTLGTTPGLMSASATLTGAKGSPVTFHAVALSQAGMTATLVSGNQQTGRVAAELAAPLRVRVHTFGPSDAGVTVVWSTAHGRVSPTSSVTDPLGYAEAHWTLGTVATDTMVAVAEVSGAEGSPLRFTAWALPEQASYLTPAVVNPQIAYTGASYTTPFVLPVVGVFDRYGNGIPDQPLTWHVVQGPIHIVSSDAMTDENGFARVEVAPDGPPGTGIVEAALAGGNLSKQFIFSILQEPFAVLHVEAGTFSSGRNGSNPAVDTIPAGGTMHWIAEGWDYEIHTVVPMGIPSFPEQPLEYGAASETFTTPGTYQYQDAGIPTATGTVVVQ